jgi:3-oxoacyl-[acyl-carrier protein] reductase
MAEGIGSRGELDGKVAIVTGGSRGIGRAICAALAEGGARVAVVARDGARAAEAAAGLEGTGHAGYACDVADGSAIEALLKSVEQDLGAPDILVNNAGITQDNLLVRMSDEQWDAVMDTNLKGSFLLIRAVSKGMMRRRSGRIVNITSVVGIIGNKGQANYSASKAGLIGLTKSVAKELASRNILCNAVAPGFIETDMTGAMGDAAQAELSSRIPLGRLGTAADVAGVVRFLAGPAAGYITGQVIVVDGGMVI